MKKLLLLASIFVVSLLLMAVLPTYAANFKLNSIGSLDVFQKLYSHMWYTGSQPTFSGSGTSGAGVNITLDSNSYSTTVGTDEQWNFRPPSALENTDHNLVFSSEGQTISLILTTGSNVPSDFSGSTGTQSGTPSALPQTGLLTPTLTILGIGILLTSSFLFRKINFGPLFHS